MRPDDEEKTMGLLKRLKKLIGDERGNALAIGAAAMPLVIGGAGLALDTVQISLAKRQLQRSADSAALAGAHAVNQNGQAAPAVTRDLVVNNHVPLSGAPVVQNAPATGPYAGNNTAVRVQLSARQQLTFLSFFISPPTMTVEATAAAIREGDFCMLSLEDGNTTGITVNGNATIAIGCGISANSRSAQAITADGSSRVTASPIMAVGGVPASAAYTSGTQILPFAPVQVDPLAHLPLPAPTNCTNGQLSVQPGETRSIGPGDVCYDGMDIKGTLNIQPNTTVYVNGGVFDLGSQAQVSGSNVTIVLTSTNATSNPASIATVNINGGAQLNLTAPTSGSFANVLFYQDPRATLGNSIHINGNSATRLQGAFYFPRANFTFNGTTGMVTECMQVVARRLNFSGNASIGNSCSAAAAARSFRGTFVRLVD